MAAPIPSLTGLRFFAAFSVVISHAIPAILKYQDPPLWIALLSYTAVEGMTLFFVLSGFVIYYNYSESIRQPVGLYNFFVARFSRLYPLYFIGVTYDLLTKYAYQTLPDSLAALPYYATMTQTWFYKPIGHFGLIYQYGIVPAVAWSISTEWFFYLAFPLLCFAIASVRSLRGRLLGALVLVVATLITFIYINLNELSIQRFGVEQFGDIAADSQDSFFRWLMYFSPYVRVFEFALGCLCASIYMSVAARTPSQAAERRGFWMTVGSLAGLVLLHVLMFGVQTDAVWHRVLYGLRFNFGFAPFLAILIFCCARYKNAIVRAVSSPMLVMWGEASYSLYLLHMVAIYAFRWESAPVTTARVAIGSYLHLALCIMSAIGMSLVSWALIEVPARRALRRLLTFSSGRVQPLEVETVITHPLSRQPRG